MLSLKLYPAEFLELLNYLYQHTKGQDRVPLPYQSVGKLVLGQYLAKWTPSRILAWKQRRANKAFAFRLPETVALALYQDMLGGELTPMQQMLLSKLDQAMVNHRP